MRRVVWLAALVAFAGGVLITPGASAGPLQGPTWSPSTKGAYDFAWLTVGQSVSQRFTLSNPGTSASGTLTVELKGSLAFTLAADSCTGTSLGPRQTCSVRVAYSPSAAGASDATTLFAVGKKKWQVSLPLTGVGIAVGAGHIYWAHPEAIGRANLDGSNPNQSFVPAGLPYAVAVDSSHIYWADTNTGTIGRANLDGSNPDQNFITTANYPSGVAVDSGHVYWTNASTGSIGRANLDGTHRNQNFISGANASGESSVAVDSAHVYWTNANKIGRANLNGTHRNRNFITTANYPFGVAVDSGHVYWTNGGTETVGRANLDGTHRNQNFITGSTDIGGVAVAGGHVYWTNTEAATIGRADVDGSNVNQSFITDNWADQMAVGPD
jgi:virginiamycin B lyase